MEFEVHAAAMSSINALAEAARRAIEPLDLKPVRQTEAHSWAPDPSFTLTDKDIVGDPIAWIETGDGTMAWAFAWVDDVSFGISEVRYIAVDALIAALLKIKWVKATISDDYIRNSFVTWARRAIRSEVVAPFGEEFLAAAKRDVTRQDVWAPLQYLKIEEAFQFGDVRFVCLDERYFEQIAEIGSDFAEEERSRFDRLIEHMKTVMLDGVAVTMQVEAEPLYAKTVALQVAADAVGLLRFFSVAAFQAQRMATVSLLDALILPQSHILVGKFPQALSYSSAIAAPGADFWQISRADYAELSKGNWSAVASLLDKDQLSAFGETIRSSILAYSRALTFPDIADRLVFALSAVEGLLLRDQSEPIQQNVGERMAFLTTTAPAKRQAIVVNLREAYRMRSHYIHHRLSNADVAVLDETFLNIWTTLSQALANLQRFKTKLEFIDAIEKRKYGA